MMNDILLVDANTLQILYRSGGKNALEMLKLSTKNVVITNEIVDELITAQKIGIEYGEDFSPLIKWVKANIQIEPTPITTPDVPAHKGELSLLEYSKTINATGELNIRLLTDDNGAYNLLRSSGKMDPAKLAEYGFSDNPYMGTPGLLNELRHHELISKDDYIEAVNNLHQTPSAYDPIGKNFKPVLPMIHEAPSFADQLLDVDVNSLKAISVGIAIEAFRQLGITGDLLSLGITAAQAEELHEAGDIEGANQAWISYFLEAAGGVAAGAGVIALGVGGGSILGVLAVAVAAGYVGAKAGEGIAALLFENFPDLSARLLGDLHRSLYEKTGLQSLVGFINKQFGLAEKAISPIVLDLDGNGISTLGTSSGIHFDHDGNNFAELTGWLSAGDGLLVLDSNANQLIDSGRELFGNHTLLKDGTTAANGFAALAAHDSNTDGVINAADAIWSDLQIWKDISQDGISQSNELYSLNELGIASINLAYIESDYVDEHDNAHKQVGEFTWQNGELSAAVDVWFAINLMDTEAKNQIDIPDIIAELPNLLAFGNVHSLHQAMAQAEDDHLLNLVTQFMQMQNFSAHPALMTELLYAWVGVTDLDPGSRGPNIDARKLAVLEAFLGEGFIQHYGNTDPRPFSLEKESNPDNIVFLRSGNNLILKHTNEQDQITVQDYFHVFFGTQRFMIESLNAN